MKKLAIITLSESGANLAQMLQPQLQADLFIHDIVDTEIVSIDPEMFTRFSKVADLTADIFGKYSGLVYIMPCGVVARATAPLLCSKLTDPAVVVMDVLGRWAVSFLSGHEGGANDLAMQIANICSAEPVITTTSETVKDIICGIGCRKGSSAEDILAAIGVACKEAEITTERIRLIATVRLKEHEAGLIQAASELDVPVRIIADEEIKNCVKDFDSSELVLSKTGLPAVAEPCALLAGRRTTLILKRITHNGVTVALTQECCG